MSILTFSVPDISCGHERAVTVAGDVAEEFLRAAIEESGYTVQGPATRCLP